MQKIDFQINSSKGASQTNYRRIRAPYLSPSIQLSAICAKRRFKRFAASPGHYGTMLREAVGLALDVIRKIKGLNKVIREAFCMDWRQ